MLNSLSVAFFRFRLSVLQSIKSTHERREDYWTGDPASAHLLEVLMPLRRCWNDPTKVVFMFQLPCWPYEVSWGTLGFEDMSEL